MIDYCVIFEHKKDMEANIDFIQCINANNLYVFYYLLFIVPINF